MSLQLALTNVIRKMAHFYCLGIWRRFPSYKTKKQTTSIPLSCKWPIKITSEHFIKWFIQEAEQLNQLRWTYTPLFDVARFEERLVWLPFPMRVTCHLTTVKNEPFMRRWHSVCVFNSSRGETKTPKTSAVTQTETERWYKHFHWVKRWCVTANKWIVVAIESMCDDVSIVRHHERIMIVTCIV